jgi:proteasome assembly chaperone (PAC2) family protein
MPLRNLKSVTSAAPVLVAGWPGMGQVGLGAADYLRRKLGGSLVARIDVTPYFQPESIEVEAGLGRVPAPPRQSLYHVTEPPLLVFVGDGQLSGDAGLRLAGEVLDYAQAHGVESVFTGAAYAMPISYRQSTEVFGVATDERLKSRFAMLGVELLKEGRITGLNGLLLGLARSRGVSAGCFLATMPQYAVETPNPRAARAVLRVFERILNTSVDLAEIDEAVRDTDRLLEEFENRVSEAIRNLKSSLEQQLGSGAGRSASGTEEAETDEGARPEPHELMERIERMFDDAQRDRTSAILLKQELDRWGLFALYEDRFLDLFEQKTS